MNIYIIVEGRTEKPVYRCWIPLVNPNLSYVNHIKDMVDNNFSIISGKGYPNYLSVIEDAIADVNDSGNIGKLIISVDSEDDTKEDKLDEIQYFISDKPCVSEVVIIIQHFCIETWALGNRRIIKRNPQHVDLLRYRQVFNVLNQDPELLPPLLESGMNRAQFAYKYLRVALKDRFSHITYTKSRPKPLMHQRYFREVRERYENTGDISSFSDFLNAF
jgi:hypothetical protein